MCMHVFLCMYVLCAGPDLDSCGPWAIILGGGPP